MPRRMWKMEISMLNFRWAEVKSKVARCVLDWVERVHQKIKNKRQHQQQQQLESRNESATEWNLISSWSAEHKSRQAKLHNESFKAPPSSKDHCSCVSSFIRITRKTCFPRNARNLSHLIIPALVSKIAEAYQSRAWLPWNMLIFAQTVAHIRLSNWIEKKRPSKSPRNYQMEKFR